MHQTKNKTMKKNVIVLLALIVIASACKKEETVAPNPTNSIEQPFSYLKVGNQWVYDFEYNGNVVDSLVTTIEAMENDIFELKTSDMTRTEISYQFVEGDYIKQYNKGQTKEQAIRIASKNPQINDTWTVKGANSQNGVVYTIKEVDMQITVPAGTFTCTKIEGVYPGGSKLITYTDKKYSIVKMEFLSGNTPAIYNLRTINIK